MFTAKKIMSVAIIALAVAAPGIAQAEGQPAMQAALKNLKEARQNLEQASHDKGGHRGKAMKMIDDAIEQVKAGMKFDNKH